jgi:hypothetical protein
MVLSYWAFQFFRRTTKLYQFLTLQQLQISFIPLYALIYLFLRAHKSKYRCCDSAQLPTTFHSKVAVHVTCKPLV